MRVSIKRIARVDIELLEDDHNVIQDWSWFTQGKAAHYFLIIEKQLKMSYREFLLNVQSISEMETHPKWMFDFKVSC